MLVGDGLTANLLFWQAMREGEASYYGVGRKDMCWNAFAEEALIIGVRQVDVVMYVFDSDFAFKLCEMKKLGARVRLVMGRPMSQKYVVKSQLRTRRTILDTLAMGLGSERMRTSNVHAKLVAFSLADGSNLVISSSANATKADTVDCFHLWTSQERRLMVSELVELYFMVPSSAENGGKDTPWVKTRAGASSVIADL